MRIEPAHDEPLVGIEQTLTRRRRAAGPILLDARPLGDGLRVQAQGASGLSDRQALTIKVIANLAIGLVVQHRSFNHEVRSRKPRSTLASAALSGSGAARRDGAAGDAAVIPGAHSSAST